MDGTTGVGQGGVGDGGGGFARFRAWCRRSLPASVYRRGSRVMGRWRRLRRRLRDPRIMYYGQPMRINGQDEVISKSLSDQGTFDDGLVRTCLKHVVPGAVVVDGGANIGVFAIPLAQAVGPEGIVLAVEPERRNLRLLAGNLARAGARQVRVVPFALGRSSGTARLHLSQDNKGMHSLGKAAVVDVVDEQAVQLVSLDGLVAQFGLGRLDLIKLDIQGAEGLALEGATMAIDRFRPVILFEHSAAFAKACDADIAPTLDRLDRLGYRYEVIDPQTAANASVTSADIIRQGQSVELNVLAIPGTVPDARG